MLVFEAIACFLMAVAAVGQAKDRKKMGEYVPAEIGKGEPSCEELRMMWRFSKRQSRAAEITNEIPQYRDPFVYNLWDNNVRTKSMMSPRRPIYGRVVHTAPPGVQASSPMRMRAFEEVARMFGSPRLQPAQPAARKQYRYSGGGDSGVVPQAGSFQQLKDLVRAERARELQQKYAEEQADYGRIMHGPPPPPPKDDSAYGSLRYGRFEEPSRAAAAAGILAFPDVLAPASRLDDYSGFGSFEYPAAYSGETAGVKTKHRSSVTKGRRVYMAPRD